MKILDDLRAVKKRDPACRSYAEAVLLYSGFHAIFDYRIAHFFYKIKLYFIARLISQNSRFFTGIEIHPGAKIGRGFFIDHGAAVVIGETTEIGENCTIYQAVTLGGTGKDTGKRHPTLGDDVMIGAGAKVLGPVKIGSHSKVAAGAVVLSDIPDHATAVGVPARVVKIANERVCETLDQINIPDPIANELSRLEKELHRMEKRIKELEKK